MLKKVLNAKYIDLKNSDTSLNPTSRREPTQSKILNGEKLGLPDGVSKFRNC